MKTIDNSGLKSQHSNGAWTQTILVEHEGVLFRMFMKSESYDFQSPARLSVMGNDNKWEIIKSVNVPKDYDINIAYSRNPSERTFNPIVTDFKKLIKSTAKFLTKNN